MDRLYREYSGKLVTSLVSFFKLPQLRLAEDIVQETFISALNSWSINGLPDNPPAWLFKTCKNKALNELDRKYHKGRNAFSPQLVRENAHQLGQCFLDSEIRDNQLRLLFAA